jgi:hypothetical protein
VVKRSGKEKRSAKPPNYLMEGSEWGNASILSAEVQAKPGDQCEGDHREDRDKCGGRADIARPPNISGRVGDLRGIRWASIKERITETQEEIHDDCLRPEMAALSFADGPLRPDAPGLVKTYKGLANDIAVLAIQTGKSVGVSEDAVNTRLSLISKDLMGSIGNKCVMINVLFDRYDNFCKQLAKNVDARLKELLAGKKCSGIYRCKWTEHRQSLWSPDGHYLDYVHRVPCCIALFWSERLHTRASYRLMETSEDFLEFAEKCERLAEEAASEQDRNVLMQMAEAWRKVAEEHDFSRAD